MAQIHVYSGPMASGKTSKMMDIIHRYSNIHKQRVLLINYSKDDRGAEGISTHKYGDYSIRVPVGTYIDPIRVTNLLELSGEFLEKYSMIGIDEAQFYPDLGEFIHLNKKRNIMFHIAGLSYDSDNKPFGQILDIIDLATTFEKMSAVCSRCDPKYMVPAGFTFANTPKNGVIEIGGLDIYEPLCLKHYLEAERQ